MSIFNIIHINDSISEIKNQVEDNIENFPQFTLSKERQNVIVFMLDRAMGDYVPYLFNEKPELKNMFDGFTYFENVISYGGHTNFATPALFGGSFI